MPQGFASGAGAGGPPRGQRYFCDKHSVLSFPASATPDLIREARGKGTQVDQHYYVYMLASQRNGTLYTGVTGAVEQRIWNHKNGVIEGFAKKYGVRILVWYELHEDINAAIAREKQIKGWNRAWKIRLIERENSGWNDLYWKLTG
jgi:putative endonuclease